MKTIILFILTTMYIALPVQAQNYALSFNGTSNYADCGNDNSLNLTSALTIEAWIKPNSNSSIRTIVARKVSGIDSNGYAFYVNSWNTTDGKLLFETQGVTFETSASAITWEAWQHVAVTTNGTTTKIYVNGTEQTSTGSVSFVSNTSSFRIGNFSGGNNYYFDGSIDEVRVWNYVRTQTQIEDNRKWELRGNDAGLVGYFQTSAGSGTTLTDHSSNSNDGTLVNSPAWETASQLTGYAPSAGYGSSGSPYQIATLGNLFWLSQNSGVWSSYFSQTAGIDASATSGWQGGRGFTPIGNNSTNFTGEYNGSGYTISNLTIDRSGTDYVGFFGKGANSSLEIKNLGLTEVNITGQNYVGALGGYLAKPISRCFIEGTISGNQSVGGLLGYVDINVEQRSYADCTVSGLSSVGGLIGYKHGNGSAVIECYSLGTVNGTGSGYNIGGLIGNNNESGTNRNCYSRSTVNASSSYNVGGLCGNNTSEGSFSISYSTGSVTGGSSTGGLTGYNGSSISNCFWDTETSGQSSSAGGTGKTTAEMKTKSTFTDANWDFKDETTNGTNDYWDIDGVRNDGYPYLSWEVDDPLPVELISFSAVLQPGSATADETVLLNWSTATEVDNYGFEIERQEASIKNQDQSFETLGFVEGHGNSNSPKDYSFIDASASLSTSGTIQYRLKQIDTDGSFEYSEIIEVEIGLPTKFELSQNFPNPFNPSTIISYSLAQNGFVQLKVYDILGREVATLVNKKQAPGRYTIEFNASALSSGIYLYKLTSGKFVKTRKLMLIK